MFFPIIWIVLGGHETNDLMNIGTFRFDTNSSHILLISLFEKKTCYGSHARKNNLFSICAVVSMLYST